MTSSVQLPARSAPPDLSRGRSRAAVDDSSDDAKTSFQSVLQDARSANSDSDTDTDTSSSGNNRGGSNKDSKDSKKPSSNSDTTTVPVHVQQIPHDILPIVIALPLLQQAIQTSPDASTNTAPPSASPAPTDDSEDTTPVPVNPAPKVDASDAPPSTSAAPIAFAAKLGPQNQDSQTDTPDPGPEPAEPHARAVPQKSAPVVAAAPGASEPATAKADKADPTTDSTTSRWAKIDIPTPAPASPAPPQATTQPIKPAAVPETTAAARIEPVAPTPPVPPSSSHDITVRIPDATERGMDVRFVDRGGEVHVSVRTADTEMAQTLRGGLNDFVGRMEHAGIRAEVWRPGADASSSQDQSQDPSQNQNTDHRGGRNYSGSRGSNQQPPDQQEQGQNKPRWVEELETSLGNQAA